MTNNHCYKIVLAFMFLLLSVGQLYGYDNHRDVSPNAWTEYYLDDDSPSGLQAQVSEDDWAVIEAFAGGNSHVNFYWWPQGSTIIPCDTSIGSCGNASPGSKTYCPSETPSCAGTYSGGNCHLFPGYWQAARMNCYVVGGAGETWIQVIKGRLYSTADRDPNTYDTDGDGMPDAVDPTPNFDDPDNDDDGLRNEIDPSPDSDTDVNMLCVIAGFDSNGDACYWVMYDQNTGQYIQMGDSSQVDGEPVQNIPPLQIDDQTYSDMFGEGGTYEGTEFTNDNFATIDMEFGEDPTAGSDPNAVSGVDATGNVTDLDHLEDIVNNTNSEITNQNLEIDYLRSINERLGNLQQQNITNNYTSTSVVNEGDGGETGDFPTAGEIGTAVNDALNTNTEPTVDTSAIDTAYSGFNTEAAKENSLTDILDEEQRARKTVETRMEEIETEMNATSNIITDTEVTTVGSCQLSFDYKGHAIEMGICGYETQLQAWGVVIMMLAGLHCILIVFRR